jgi:hypothetical protein
MQDPFVWSAVAQSGALLDRDFGRFLASPAPTPTMSRRDLVDARLRVGRPPGSVRRRVRWWLLSLLVSSGCVAVRGVGVACEGDDSGVDVFVVAFAE